MANTYEYRIRVEESNINQKTNESTVTCYLEFRCTNNDWHGWNYYSGQSYWEIMIDGVYSGHQNLNPFDWTVPKNVWKTVGIWSRVVKHDADGRKNIQCYGYCLFNISTPKSFEASQWLNLTRINRGVVQIQRNGSFSEHAAYIYHNDAWRLYQPMVYHNGSWKEY